MKRQLRILVAHNVSGNRTGGMSRIMGFIHDHVALRGHLVDYFCAEDYGQHPPGGWHRLGYSLAVLKHARAMAANSKPYDVINVHEPSGAAISLMKRIAGNPRVVVTSHGLESRGWNRSLEEVRLGRDTQSFRTRMTYPATVLLPAQLALKMADHVFCLNLEDRQHLIEKHGIPETRVTRIRPAADQIYSQTAKDRDYSTANKILFAGTWLKRKGTLDLIPAFTTLARKHLNLRLVVLNCGIPESSVNESFPAEVRDRIIHQRTHTETETANAFAAADIYLLPSLFEGTPLTLIEAMFSGLPIITTDICGMKDTIEHGRTGLLVPIRAPDAIVGAVDSLLASPPTRCKLGQCARTDAVQRYTWETVAHTAINAYEQLFTQACR